MHGIIVLVEVFLLDCLLGDPHNQWSSHLSDRLSDQFSGKENTETFSQAAQR